MCLVFFDQSGLGISSFSFCGVCSLLCVTRPKICRPHAGIRVPSCHIDAGHPAPPATWSALLRFSSGRTSAGMMPVQTRILCGMHVHTAQPIMPPPGRRCQGIGLLTGSRDDLACANLHTTTASSTTPSTFLHICQVLLGWYSEDSELGCGVDPCVRGQLISRSVKAVRAAGRLQGAWRAPYPYGDG
jgi:hypothetical protein